MKNDALTEHCPEDIPFSEWSDDPWPGDTWGRYTYGMVAGMLGWYAFGATDNAIDDSGGV